MSDIYQRNPITMLTPITADMVTINWAPSSQSTTPGDGEVMYATQLSIQYNQPVNRRWTLGAGAKNLCVIYPGRPLGSIQIQRLFADTNLDVFGLAGWGTCKDWADITIDLSGASSSISEKCEGMDGGIFTCKSAIVTSYGLTAEAEGLTVMDNINIEFMQMTQGYSVS